MKSCTKMIFWVLMVGLVVRHASGATLAEYKFQGLSVGTTIINSSGPLSGQPLVRFPSISNGGNTANDPILHTYGLYITNGKYANVNSRFAHTEYCTYYTMWVNIIEGAPKQFSRIGIENVSANRRIVQMHGDINSGVLTASYTWPGGYLPINEMQYGWNALYADVLGTDYFAYSVYFKGAYYNTNYIVHQNTLGIDSALGPYWIGCKSCSLGTSKYIIHSLTAGYNSNSQRVNTVGISSPMIFKCGEGTRDSGEACDDDNLITGDGCGDLCTVESQWTCSGGSPSTRDTCTDTCGDGVTITSMPTTYCDDGDNTSGDGCSTSCAVEAKWACSGASTTTPSLCNDICTDGFVVNRNVTDYCDDGNTNNGDGCSNTCQTETNWVCSGGSASGSDTCNDICADGYIVKRNFVGYCDDANFNNGDGCSSGCATESKWVCSGGSASTKDTCTDICGDGFTITSMPATYCDDGNLNSNDGCSSSCTRESKWLCTGGSTTTADTCTDLCGDGFVITSMPMTYCDDGDNASGDGCSSTCAIEAKWTCTTGSSTTPSTCSDICNDGFVVQRATTDYCDDGNTNEADGCTTTCQTGTKWLCSGGSISGPDTCIDKCGDGYITMRNFAGYCDDSNSINGDGCDSTCQIEGFWTCSGGDLTTKDTCTDICGDGVTITSMPVTYCDDGNLSSNDGCSSTCTRESKWICTGGSPTTADTCNDICGDGFVVKRSSSSYCDDGNSINGDGCNSSCNTESGYVCSGGNAFTFDTCHTVCGDGILSTSFEQCDDGNLASTDGCDSTCKVESGYSCATDTSTIPHSTCGEICGDGVRTDPSLCDDGNTVSGDGCSSGCNIEAGYICIGGSPTSKDTCASICGDGIFVASTEFCDDGNKASSDGCSSACVVEPGYECVTPSGGGPQICTEICGDGKRFTSACDDGNSANGDGCSSTCTLEPGFTCTGGTPTHRDTCLEDCGDGLDYGANECEDGNLIEGDGCSATCEFEKCYACSGGTPISIDACYFKYIEVTNFTVNELDSTQYDFTFNETMQQMVITSNDMSVAIDASYRVVFSWSAEYTSLNTLSVKVDVTSVLEGSEVLRIKLSNFKKFRTPVGGCMLEDTYSTTMKSNLSSSVSTAKNLSILSKYFTYIIILALALLILLLGGSLEMLWCLINTLQLISYLPLMTPFFPEHVKVMFNILEMTNMNFEFLSDIFKSLVRINSLNVDIGNARFSSNGIDSPLFLNNAASILLTFLLYLMIPVGLVIVICILKCEKINSWLKAVLAGYFFNNFIRFLVEGYLEISFGAFLNVYIRTFGSFQEISSFVVAVIVSIVCLIFPFYTAVVIYDKRKEIYKENEVYLARFGVIYKDIDQQRHWVNTMYYPAFMARRLIFVGCLVTLTNYTQIQCNAFVFCSFMTFCYLVLACPFKEKINNILCIINEGCLCCIAFIQLVFITDIKDLTIINMTGWVMIAVCITNICINFAITIYHSISNKCKKRVKKSESRKSGVFDISATNYDQPAQTTKVDTSVVSRAKMLNSKKKPTVPKNIFEKSCNKDYSHNFTHRKNSLAEESKAPQGDNHASHIVD